ncbi:hypothetical protein SNEBB_011106 [Seison nebaliae]|nr:hypothetical protein SNEBB_011106 [Seison nebaliae]
MSLCNEKFTWENMERNLTELMFEEETEEKNVEEANEVDLNEIIDNMTRSLPKEKAENIFESSIPIEDLPTELRFDKKWVENLSMDDVELVNEFSRMQPEKLHHTIQDMYTITYQLQLQEANEIRRSLLHQKANETGPLINRKDLMTLNCEAEFAPTINNPSSYTFQRNLTCTQPHILLETALKHL